MDSSEKLDKIYDMVYEIYGNQKVLNEKILTTQSSCNCNKEDIVSLNSRLNTINHAGLPIRAKDWLGIVLLNFTLWGLLIAIIQVKK